MKFIIYNHKIVLSDGMLITRQFVALKHDNRTLQFTDFHKYIKPTKNRIRPITDDGNSRFYFVVQLLNYAFFERGISQLDDISVEIVSDFLNAYATNELPSDGGEKSRNADTVKRCVQYIMDFLTCYIYMRGSHCEIKTDDLYREIEKRDKNGRVITVKEPAFDVLYKSVYKKPILRDLPDKVFRLLLEHIAWYHKELLGVVILGAFAGLRPSEALNVRREDSLLGPGILFSIVDNELLKVQIDLRCEMNLRSDYVSVGKIKRERIQEVPDLFLPVFRDLYNAYMEYMEGKKYEAEYGPFSINKRGKALTYPNYYQKFQHIIKEEMIPVLLRNNDPEIKMYGRILMENNLSPHIFRHWYTVQLVLSGVNDPATLMFWRGDRSTESAITYLENKGELERLYKKVNNRTFDFLMSASRQERSIDDRLDKNNT